MVGSLALGMGPLFWGFATEAEVYTLDTFLLSAALFYAACYADSGSRRAFLCGAFFLVLGFANHLTSLFLVPAFVYVVYAKWRAGARLRGVDVLLVLVFAVLSASLYAYVPFRIHAQYSEFKGELGARTFWEYVTAKEFQSSFGHFSFSTGVFDRMPSLVANVQRQWLWPLLFAVPFGMWRLRVLAPAFFGLICVALLALGLFAYGYAIPDPEGFFMPIVVLLAIAIGAASTKLPEQPTERALTWAAGAICLACSSFAHLLDVSREVGFEVYEDIGEGRGKIQWDIENVLRTIPEGAKLAVPCDHYGCVQVLNYYRFSDPIVAQRRIEFLRLPGVGATYWDLPTAVQAAEASRARDIVICTLREGDVKAWKEQDIAFATIVRDRKQLRNGLHEGVKIYCSTPAAARQAAK